MEDTTGTNTERDKPLTSGKVQAIFDNQNETLDFIRKGHCELYGSKLLHSSTAAQYNNTFTMHADTKKAKLQKACSIESRRRFFENEQCPSVKGVYDDPVEAPGQTIIYQQYPGQYREFKEGSHYILEKRSVKKGGYSRVYTCAKGPEAKVNTPDRFVVKTIPIFKYNSTELAVPLALGRKKKTFFPVLLAVKEEGCVKIFMPLAELGNLSECQCNLVWISMFKIAKFLTEDLAAMHENDNVHFDIKRENVVIFIHENRICGTFIDFGSTKMKGRCLYWRNMSVLNQVPELKRIRETAKEMQNDGLKDFYDGEVLKPVDIFQHGALLLYLFSGKQFLEDKWRETKRRCNVDGDCRNRRQAEQEHAHMVASLTEEEISEIVDGFEFPNVPENKKHKLRDLTKKMLNPKATNRPKIEEVMQDDFFSENDRNADLLAE